MTSSLNYIVAGKIMTTPLVTGFVQCAETGDVVMQDGEGMDALGGSLSYIHQAAVLIGDALGQEGFLSAQLSGKEASIVCLPHDGGAYGVRFAPGARISDSVITHLKESLSS